MPAQMSAQTAPTIRASGNAFQRHMNGLLHTRFQLKPLDAHAYDGEILQSYVSDRLRLADIRFTPHSTRLMPGRASTEARNSFLVSWQIEGTSVVRQGGREAHIGPGELFFIDTSRPFEIETDDIWTRSVYLDSQFWREAFPARDCYTATALRCDVGMGHVCAELIDQLFPAASRQSPDILMRMAGSLVHLLAVSMLAELPEPTTVSSGDELTLERIKAFLRENLSDPDLDCSAVAQHLNISARHVHHIFVKSGTTLMRWVWHERLKRIARDLGDPALLEKPVSAIAFDWGFSEAAHFSHRFKACFDMTPTQFRQQAHRQITARKPTRPLGAGADVAPDASDL